MVEALVQVVGGEPDGRRDRLLLGNREVRLMDGPGGEPQVLGLVVPFLVLPHRGHSLPALARGWPRGTEAPRGEPRRCTGAGTNRPGLDPRLTGPCSRRPSLRKASGPPAGGRIGRPSQSRTPWGFAAWAH